MEALVQMFGGAATLIAVLGGAMATICFAWAGIQWMMASGDPQTTVGRDYGMETMP